MSEASFGREILDSLRRLEMPAGDYAVFGSGPLLARGIIESVGDLDVICRGLAWAHACRIGSPVQHHGITLISVDDGAITFGQSWGYGTFDLDVLIDTADVIEGLPFVRLEHVREYKRIAGRPKDLEHLALIAHRGGLTPPNAP